jgi:hypothetical protein
MSHPNFFPFKFKIQNSKFLPLFFSFSRPFALFAVKYLPKDSALRVRIAQPFIKNVSRKMRDTASETLALPFEEAPLHTLRPLTLRPSILPHPR